MEMESRFNWNDSGYQKRKKAANDAYKNVKEEMKKVKEEIFRIKDVDADTLEGMLFKSIKNQTIKEIYENLCEYYKNNISMWSNFKSMWKKLHKWQRRSVGEATDRRQIVASAIVAATGSREYSRVKKGIIPHLRLEDSYKSPCEKLLQREKQLKSDLSKGLTKVRNEDIPGPIMSKRTLENL